MLNATCRFVVGLSLFLTLPALAADHGLFMVVKGSVKVISGSDKKESAAKVGSKVFSGDTVVTEKDARAKIVMSDRNVLQLSPDSKLEITKYKTGATEKDREVQVALASGKIRVEVEQKYGEKNKFELRTPTAVAGVRGTKYVAQYNQATNISSISVLSGTVVVGSVRGGAPVTLTANMMSTVANNAAPMEPRKMSPQERNDVQNEAAPAAAPANGGGDAPAGSGAGGANTAPAESTSTGASTSGTSESLVSSDLKGPEVKQEASSRVPASVPGQGAPPMVMPPQVPKPPQQNILVNDVIQNKNSKTKVIITPVPK